MSYPITVSLIPGLPTKAYRHGVGAYEGVVAHATANYGDSDEGERNYEAAHWNDAFVHFFVDHDSITQVANTDYLAWGAGPNANPRFVHVELCQSHDHGQFQEAYKRYVWLLAKILKDKNLGVTRKGTLWTHSDVTKELGGTTHQDPDAYLAEHGVSIDQLVADVTAEYNGPVTVAPKQAQAPAPVAAAPVQGKSIDQLAQDVIKGLLGSGSVRVRALGAQYDAVQARVNEILTGKAKPAPAPQPSIDDLAQKVIRGELGSGDARRQALGAQYDAVQARVNEILGGSKPAAAPQPSVHDLAMKVIRGEFGSGDARKAALGSRYAEVQAEVNRILG